MTAPQQSQQEPPKIERSYNLFDPGGDPSVLRACAEAWRGMAQDLRSTIENQDAQVSRLGDQWTGTAADAFRAHWNHTRSQVEAALPHFETVAQQLDSTADALAKVNAEVHRVIEELTATIAVGIGLSVLTMGFSDVIAAGAADAEIAEAAGEVTRLGQLLIRVAEIMQRVDEAMKDSNLLKFTFNFAKNFDANLIGSAGGQALSGQKVDLLQDIQDSAVSGAVGAGLGMGGALAGDGIARWSLSTGAHGQAWVPGTRIAAALNGEGRVGGATMGIVTGLGGQAAADGLNVAEGSKHASQIPEDLAFAAGTGAATGAANHAAEKYYESPDGKQPDPGQASFTPDKEIKLGGAIGATGAAIQNDLDG